MSKTKQQQDDSNSDDHTMLLWVYRTLKNNSNNHTERELVILEVLGKLKDHLRDINNDPKACY